MKMSNEKTGYAQGLELLRRPLELHEIEFRVQSVKDKGAILLAYKTARVDMNRLDESGLNWQNDYQSIDGKLFCHISVHNPELEQWISKSDTGTESNQDKQKGEASDAFKRAGFRWGIGRELYDFPFIWCNKLNPSDKFYDVRDWIWGMEYKDGRLFKLAAKDKAGNLRYNWKLPPTNTKPDKAITRAATTKAQDEIEGDFKIDSLIASIKLAKTEEMIFKIVDGSGVDRLEPRVAAAIDAQLVVIRK